MYQNDGTDTIKASHFVEKAARSNRGWQTVIFAAIAEYLNGITDWKPIEQVGLEVAYDINNAVDRIKTGRLKKSFRPKIKKTGAGGWVDHE